MGTVTAGAGASINTGTPLGHIRKPEEPAQLIPDDHRTPPSKNAILIGGGLGAIVGSGVGAVLTSDAMAGMVNISRSKLAAGIALGAVVGAGVFALATSILGSSYKSNAKKSEYVIDDERLSKRVNDVFAADQVEDARRILADSSRTVGDAHRVFDMVDVAEVSLNDELDLFDHALDSRHSGKELLNAAVSVSGANRDVSHALGTTEHHGRRMDLIDQIIKTTGSLEIVPALLKSRWVMAASGDELGDRLQVAQNSGLNNGELERVIGAISKVEYTAGRPHGRATIDLGKVLAMQPSPTKILQASDAALALYDAQRPEKPGTARQMFFDQLG